MLALSRAGFSLDALHPVPASTEVPSQRVGLEGARSMPQHRWEGSGEEAEQGLSQTQPREVKLNKVQALLTKTSGKSAIKLLTKKAP